MNLRRIGMLTLALLAVLLPAMPVAAAQNGAWLSCQMQAVGLAGYEIVPGNGGVLIKWETSSELNNLGFDLYRARGTDLTTAVKINQELIPSKAQDSTKGASYTYLDGTARAGVIYNYWLQDTEAVGAPGQDPDAYFLGVQGLGSGRWSEPKNLRVMPASGGKPAGSSEDFVATFKDADGDLATVYMIIGTAPELGNGIGVKYDVASGLLSMYDGRRGGWQEGIRPRQRKNLSCQYGSLRGFGSRAFPRKDGKIVRVVFMLKTWLRFRGQYRIFMMSEDAAGNSTGWDAMGTWDVQ